MAFIVPNQAQIASQRPIASPNWTRPTDWISITDTPNEVQFLVSSIGGGNYGITTSFTKPAAQNLYIDWGDGVIDTISVATSTTTYHTFTTGGTACSLGYSTWKVRIYVDAGATITNARNVAPQKASGSTIAYGAVGSGLLEAYYGDGVNISSYNNYFQSSGSGGLSSSVVNMGFLKYVKLPSVVLGSHNLGNGFNLCVGLSKVVLPISMSGLTSMSGCFQGCYSLEEVINFPTDATSLTTMANAFNNCYSLTGITFPSSLPAVTSMNNCFNSCVSLGNIQLPSLPVCTDYTSCFTTCHSLLSINITGFTSSAAALTLTSMFQNCYSIEQILLPSSLATGSEAFNCNLGNTFNLCANLKTITLPTNLNATTMNSTFLNNYALCSATLPTNMSGLTNMISTFQNCYNLQSVQLPTSVGSAINMSNTFNSCISISGITIPSGWTLGASANIFANCWEAVSLNLPNNTQNSITDLGSAFANCYSLTGATLPTSLNSCTSISNMFQNTPNLYSITFPTTMNSCTTMGSIFDLSGVRSVSFPTSMTSLVTMNAAFQNAFNIETIVCPASVNSGSTMGSFAFFAQNLKSITFPSSVWGVSVLASNMLNTDCNLQTINNLQFWGQSGTTSTNYINATTLFTNGSSYTGTLDFYTKFAKLELQGTSATIKSSLTGLRLRNTGAGQYAGTSPQINISYTNLSQAALVQVFNDLPTITAKTINITGASGAAALTPAERAIATGKGWTIVG